MLSGVERTIEYGQLTRVNTPYGLLGFRVLVL